jgi:hypothetical protein
MGNFRKIITTGLIAATLATAVLASTPASAWYRRYGWYGGGWGWWSAPAIAATELGALAIAAVTPGAGAYPFYGECYGSYRSCGYPAAYNHVYPVQFCVVRSPVYDDWGNCVGYQRQRVAC